MLRIKEIIADGVKKFALLRLQDNGSYTELGVYARNAYAVKKAKAIMSQTKEVIECKFNGVLDVWKLQDDELVSNEADQLQAIERMKVLLQKAEQERDFCKANQSVIVSDDNSTVQTNSPEQNKLNIEDLCDFRVYADGTVQYADELPFSFMSDDFCLIKAFSEEEAFQIWEKREKDAFSLISQGCSADKRNALCACAVAGQPRSPPLG